MNQALIDKLTPEERENMKPTGRRYDSVRDMMIGTGVPKHIIDEVDRLSKVPKCANFGK
jgi:hypothetical protein